MMISKSKQMRNNYSFVWIGMLVLAMVACIKPVNVEVPNRDDGLVISATLTTLPGLQEVQLSRLAAFTTKALNYAVSKAQVWITDDFGQRQNFVEQATKPGLYLPVDNNYVGEVGKTYVLHVSTPDGQQYESTPQLIKAVPAINKVYREEIITENPRSDVGESVSGFKVLLDLDDSTAKGDYYRWTWVNYDPVGYCHTYDWYPIGFQYGTLVGVPCCQPCWDINPCYLGCTNVLSDLLVNGKSITRHEISKIPYCREDYYLEIRQRSISKKAYEYWRIVDQLSNNNGGLFDQAPAAVKSNLTCISDPEQEVYGLFEASDIFEGGYFISRRNTSRPGLNTCAPVPVPESTRIEGGLMTGIINCAECIESPYRTRIKPKYWNR